MAAKMIDDLENIIDFFLRVIHCHTGIGQEEKIEEKDLNFAMVAETGQKRSL